MRSLAFQSAIRLSAIPLCLAVYVGPCVGVFAEGLAEAAFLCDVPKPNPETDTDSE